MPTPNRSLPSRASVLASQTLQATTWIGAGAAALWFVMSLTYPFGWDQGIFAWAGGVITQGGLPYRDAWDLKGPLAYYVYALAEVLFGVNLWGIRLLDAVLLVSASVALGKIAALAINKAAGRVTALVYVLWYASHSYWHTAQPDGWTGMLLVMALAPVVTHSTPLRARTLSTCAIVIGVVTLFKPLYALFLVLPALQVSLSQSMSRGRALAVILAGWLLPIALTTGWFWLRGGLDDLIAVHLQYSAAYAGLSSGGRLRGLVEYFLSGRVMASATPLVIYGAVVLWQRGQRSTAVIGGTWLALGVGCVAAQNRFYAYHWLPLLPAATLLGMAGLHALLARVQLLGSLVGTLILIQCLAPVALEELRFVEWVTGRTNREAYYRAYGESADDMRAVWWLREQGQPGPVFVFGWNTGVAWLSERPIVSRFGFSMPLMMGQHLGVRAEYRAEVLDALRATPPRYVVLGTLSERILGESLQLADFPELAEFVARQYREAIRLGRLTIYEHTP